MRGFTYVSLNFCFAVVSTLAVSIVWADAQAQSSDSPAAKPTRHSGDSFPAKAAERSAVYVEPVTLTEVQESSGFSLNVGAVVADSEFGRGIQKAADVYGLKLNLFVLKDPQKRKRIAQSLLEQGDTYILVDRLANDDWSELTRRAASRNTIIRELDSGEIGGDKAFDQGFSELTAARAALLEQIPKYDQVLPIAFPISPLPDDFFQPSKFPYPSPLVRAPRTNESFSASVHAHVSCNMVAQTGNMLHRTSSIDPNRLLMGMEGGNLSLQATAGAIDTPKISAVMTSWVLNIADQGAKREILVENNGLESSLFETGIHAPEELAIGLDTWQQQGTIQGYHFIDHEYVSIEGWDGAKRLMRAGLFLVANDRSVRGPVLVAGTDFYGAKTIDFYSTQAFVQQLVEVLDPNTRTHTRTRQPKGGLLTAAGTTTGNMMGAPLSHMLRKVAQKSSPVQPYVLNIEGGFMIVTPELPLDKRTMQAKVKRLYLDLRGPLTSDQTIRIDLENDRQLIFRRTVLSFGELDQAIDTLRTMGIVAGWDYEGARGRGLYANVVLHNFLGKHRKFMSSLSTWPTEERPEKPLVRFYVDGMQRLNFTFISTDGWRQEFVEVPLRIPPVPRDVALFSGKSSLN